MTPDAKTQLVKSLARDIGFDLVGAARAAPLLGAEYYRDWVARGYGGSMDYLRRNMHIRMDPSSLFPGASSVICVGLNYKHPDGFVRGLTKLESVCAGPVTASPHVRDAAGTIAQYARGRDYHVVMRRMLRSLDRRLRDELGDVFSARVCVDTVPLLERELAAAAGLGWIGQNTCLLNESLGSYLFLGELVTSLDLAIDRPVPDRCGRCQRCLDACPTRAFIGPCKLNASRCISYLTIEHRDLIDPGLWEGVGARVFGCDVCQQVCPYNARAPVGAQPELRSDSLPKSVNLLRLMELGSSEQWNWLRGTAATRAKPSMWRRNALISLVNACGWGRGTARLVAAACTHPDPLIRDTAGQIANANGS